MSKLDWPLVYDTWRALQKPLSLEDLLRLKVRDPETAHAVAMAQEIVPMVLRWMRIAYPDADWPPNVPRVIASCLEKYGKSAYRRHEEQSGWGIAWSEYLLAQSDIRFARQDQRPNLWAVFNDVGLQRYNRYVDNGLKVDGNTVRPLTKGQVAALTGKDRWEELVSRWEAGRLVVTNALTSSVGLSAESAILLESHLLDAAFLIADREGINAIDSGFLPPPKVEAAMKLLVELERDKYTSRRFFEAVIAKGAEL